MISLRGTEVIERRPYTDGRTYKHGGHDNTTKIPHCLICVTDGRIDMGGMIILLKFLIV